MTETFPDRIRQEIADLIGDAVEGVAPRIPGRIRFKHTDALPELVCDAVVLTVNANLCALDHPTQMRRRLRLLEILLRWYDRYLDTSGHTVATASLECARAVAVLTAQPDVLEDQTITFDDLLAPDAAAGKPGLAGYTSPEVAEMDELEAAIFAPLPTRPVLWRNKRYRLEELTHPTHVLVEGKALRHALCTSYSQPWLEQARGGPGTSQSAYCLSAWRMIEQQDVRLFSFAGRQGPLLTIPLITSHNAIGAITGAGNREPDGGEDYMPSLIDALAALDEAVGPLFLADSALAPTLLALIADALPHLQAAPHYAITSKIVILNPPADP